MNIIKLNCTACGAPISVPDDIDFINCASCGSFMKIERGEGYVALKVAEKLARAIEDSGKGTQDVIRENTQVTRSELQRLQAAQELSSAQMQLSSIQAEIRGLERAPQTAKTLSQMKTLRFAEYQAMDRIRQLDIQYSAPAPDNLLARAEFAEKEISWIDSEMNVLKQSNASQRAQIVQSLNSRKQELRAHAHDLRVRELKSRCPSFKVKELPLTDQAAAASLLGLLANDEKALRASRGTAEGSVVYREVVQRQQTVHQAWTRMEHERLSGTLISPSYQANRDDIASLNEYLVRIEQDLAHLGNPGQNLAALEIQRNLLQEQRLAQKQIRSLEKQAERAAQQVDQANRPPRAGLFAAVAAGIAAIFAGQSAPVQSTAWPAAHPGEGLAPEENAVPGSSAKPDLKSVGIGCLFGLLMLGTIIIVGITVMALAIQTPSDSGGVTVGTMFLTVTAALTAGSSVFLRRAAPNTTIGGFNIARGKPRNGLNNPKVVKALVGIMTCLITWSLCMTLMGYTSTPDGSPSIILFLIGLPLGPVLGVIAALRTEFRINQAP